MYYHLFKVNILHKSENVRDFFLKDLLQAKITPERETKKNVISLT